MPGQDRVDPPLVDVADEAPVVCPLDEELDELGVLQDRNARLVRIGVDHDFAEHVPFSGAAFPAASSRSPRSPRACEG